MEARAQDKEHEHGVMEVPMNSGEFQEVRVVLNNQLITAATFDSHEQLLWAGTQTGHVTSYYGPSCLKYTAFQAHHSEVRKMLSDAHGILSLSPNQVRYTTKQGLKIYSTGTDGMHSMHTMLRGNHLKDNYVLLAGENENFFELDLTSGDVYQKNETPYEPSTVVLKESNHYLCCGHQTGKVVLHDPDSLEPTHTLQAHNGALSDLDVNGNLLVTTGFSNRYNHLTVDPYLMVYDLRTLRAFPPVQLPIQPFLVRFMPTYTLRCLVLSQSGQFVFCQPDSLVVDPDMYQVNNQGAAIMDCCVSDNYQSLAFGDTSGFLHLWADIRTGEFVFNHSTQETVFPDEVQPLNAFAIDDWSIPLTTIPMPESSEPLLSDWPEHLLKRADRPTPPIDPDILKNMTIRQFVGYAPNPKKKLRNQVAYRLESNSSDYPYPESPMNREASSMVPKIYQRVDIKYSKYGVEGFNFKHYNKTNFSGLEIHIPNAYCNSMLQLLYLIDALRVGLCNHLCQREFCLACELGFLFFMLDTSDGQTCQATNFLRTFRTLPEASALGLLLSDNDSTQKNKSLAQTIQNWNRFVLRQLHQDTAVKKENDEKNDKSDQQFEEEEKPVSDLAEEKNNDNEPKKDSESEEGKTNEKKPVNKVSDFEGPSVIKKLFGMDVTSYRTCKCGIDHQRKVTLFSTVLTYPDLKADDDTLYPFSKVLQESMTRRQNTQAWCEKCNKYQSCKQVRKIHSLPDVINLNCHIEHPKDVEFWKKQQELLRPLNPPQSKITVHSSPPKVCRYGKFCNRQGCKFVHPGRDGEPVKTPTADLDGSFNLNTPTWLPTMILVKHNKETEEVEITDHIPDDELDEPDGIVYTLASNVCHIRDPTFGSTLVLHAHVGKDYHTRKEAEEKEQWYVFNDFAITPVSEHDALSFNMDWKVPCVLVYARRDINNVYDLNILPQISSNILYSDKSLAMKQLRFSRNFTPLNSSEVLQEGDVVGVDAEFVTLNQEESEMRGDGTLSTLRPSQMSVARITVVRGWGPLQGVPFIDDYISTSEQVVDYLTKFSGIKPGDLDVNRSSKHLTTLKTSYQKLRYLIQAKVIFIGHGLKKDFRVINLVIPRDQVIDTVDLFHLPKQRYVSLKFLAWHFLNIKIQADTHDSAEDAHTALKLYEKYRELLRAGEYVLEEELEILYDTGRQYNWQVPD